MFNIQLSLLKSAQLVKTFDVPGADPDPGLYLYHLAKTGGTTVGAYLKGLAIATGKTLAKANLVNRAEGLPDVKPEHSRWAVYGHSANRTHLHLNHDYSIIAVFRNPVERVISQYFWDHRFADDDTLIQTENFLRFMESTSVHNYQAQWLDIDAQTVDHVPDDIFQYLDTFKYVTTTGGIATLLSVIGSRNNCPSMWVQIAKENPKSEAKRILIERFSEDILRRNNLDYEIYLYACRRQKDLEQIYSSISKYTQRPKKFVLAIKPTEIEEKSGATPFLDRGKQIIAVDLESRHVYFTAGTESKIKQLNDTTEDVLSAILAYLKDED